MAAVVTAALALAGCKRGVAAAEVAELSVDDVAAQLSAGTCQVLDANGDPTRKRMGVIPGATLLTDYENYAPSELPADRSKTLVFYCVNEQCGASHAAALRARAVGYDKVAVLPAGIAGWRSAGKPTASL